MHISDYFLKIQFRMKDNWFMSHEYIFRLMIVISKLLARNVVPFTCPSAIYENVLITESLTEPGISLI